MPASAKQPSPITATGLERSWPRKRARREGPGFSIAVSCSRRAGWSQDQLGHPDQKAVSANDADGDNRPDEGGDDGEYEQLRTLAGPICLLRLCIMFG